MLFSMLLLQSLYGLTFTISKILVGYASPLFIIGIRMPIAGLLLLSYYKFFKKGRFDFIRHNFLTIIIISFFNIFMPYVLRYWAMQYISSIKAALLFNLAPFFSYGIASCLGHEKITLKKAAGLLIGFSGFLPILISHSSAETNVIGFLSMPEIAMIAAVCSATLSWILIKQLLVKESISTVGLNGTLMLIGGCLSLITSAVVEQSWTINQPLHFFAWLGLIIIITNIIYYNGYTKLLKKYSATLMMLSTLIAPLFAGISSAFLLNEKISGSSLVSGAIIFIGFYIFYTQEQADH